jgi:hypothetical protein
LPSLATLTDAYQQPDDTMPVEPIYTAPPVRLIMNMNQEGTPRLEQPVAVETRPEPLPSTDQSLQYFGLSPSTETRPEPIPTIDVGNNFGLDQPFSAGTTIGNRIAGLVPGEERYQLWPERVVREGLSAAHDYMQPNPYPEGTEENEEFERLRQNALPEVGLRMSALAGSGGLGSTTDATLGSAPFLRPALKYEGKIYKAPEGGQHLDALPAHLADEFQKQAMSGEDISNFNFGFMNHKGQFLDREKALDYAIQQGLMSPHDAKYGALTSTLLADSSKEAAAIQAAKPQIKGFEDYNDWFHGTTNEFNKFSKSKGNIESHGGQYPHFTNSSIDASANYAGIGPDLTARIENRAEQIFNQKASKYDKGEVGDDYGKVMTAAKKQATAELVGEHEGAVIPVNLKLDNPISLVDRRPTYLDFNPKYNAEGDIVKENPLAVKLYNSLQKQSKKYDFDAGKVMGDLPVYDEVKAFDLDKALRNSKHLMYAQDSKGKLAASHIIANIYKDMGFDGIVMDAKAAFPHMKNIPEGTLHAISLKKNTVQSKLTEQTLFSNKYSLVPVQGNPFEQKENK